MHALEDFFPTLIVAAGLLLAALVGAPLARRLGLPGPAAFLAVGIAAGLSGISPIEDVSTLRLEQVGAILLYAHPLPGRSRDRLRGLPTLGPPDPPPRPARHRGDGRRARGHRPRTARLLVGDRLPRRHRAGADRPGRGLFGSPRPAGDPRAHRARRRVGIQRPGRHLADGRRGRGAGERGLLRR